MYFSLCKFKEVIPEFTFTKFITIKYLGQRTSSRFWHVVPSNPANYKLHKYTSMINV